MSANRSAKGLCWNIGADVTMLVSYLCDRNVMFEVS